MEMLQQSNIEKLLEEIVDLLRTQHPATEVMGIREAAAYMDMGESFFRELIALYQIPHAPIKGKKGRGRILIRKADLDAFIESRIVSNPKDAMKLQDGRRSNLRGLNP